MLKKVLIYFVVAVAFGAIGCYFFFADKLYREGMPSQLCKEVTVTLLDSASNRFVTKDEVIGIIDGFNGKSIGTPVAEINTHLIEKLLNQKNAIKESQVSITRNGTLKINITQRKPVLRIQSSNGGFYVDETQYIFPLVPTFTSYVPIVSGNIPFTLNDGHRGKAQEDDTNWLGRMMELGNYLSSDPFWSAQIEQIYVDAKGEIILSPRIGNHKIIFGELTDIENKFNKLYTFYKHIVPAEGWDKYSAVNLKYKDQIICSTNNKKNKK
jgi:cell division protein FtsQ